MGGWLMDGFDRKNTDLHMTSVAALVDRWTMPPSGRCNERHVDGDMLHIQGLHVPDAPEVESYGQGAGRTGLNGHGAVDGMAS